MVGHGLAVLRALPVSLLLGFPPVLSHFRLAALCVGAAMTKSSFYIWRHKAHPAFPYMGEKRTRGDELGLKPGS